MQYTTIIKIGAQRTQRSLFAQPNRYYIGQIYYGDFSKICGLLRIYELYSDLLKFLLKKGCIKIDSNFKSLISDWYAFQNWIDLSKPIQWRSLTFKVNTSLGWETYDVYFSRPRSLIFWTISDKNGHCSLDCYNKKPRIIFGSKAFSSLI